MPPFQPEWTETSFRKIKWKTFRPYLIFPYFISSLHFVQNFFPAVQYIIYLSILILNYMSEIREKCGRMHLWTLKPLKLAEPLRRRLLSQTAHLQVLLYVGNSQPPKLPPLAKSWIPTWERLHWSKDVVLHSFNLSSFGSFIFLYLCIFHRYLG